MDQDQVKLEWFTEIWDTEPEIPYDYTEVLSKIEGWDSVEGIIVYNFYYKDQISVIKEIYNGGIPRFNQPQRAELYRRCERDRDLIREHLSTYMDKFVVSCMWTNGIIFADRPLRETPLEMKLRFNVEIIELTNFDLTKYINF